MDAKFKRVMLKLSGEALLGKKNFGIDYDKLSFIVKQIKSILFLEVQLSIVVGGGNIFRGLQGSDSYKMNRISADHMGMLSTVFNSLALQDILEKEGIKTRLQSAISMDKIAEPYILRKAIDSLEKNKVVIFAAGSGNPYFTTDTAAVLRAIETRSEILLKATKVDYLYDSDPEININANPIKSISYMDVIKRQLKVMDITAISLAMDANLPIMIFNVNTSGNLVKIINGHNIGTLITD